MPDSRGPLARLEAALNGAGLVILGAFHPCPEDAVPARAGKHRAATLVLAGNGGASMWRKFQASGHKSKHPLDKWSAQLFAALAKQFGARAVLPSGGPPHHPFQRWALRSGAVYPSPIGILIHPEFGLWHSYRGALIFTRRIALPLANDAPGPCDFCAEKPCLDTCPVGAFRPDFYDLRRCVGHIGRTKGNDCRKLGCRARRACPVGREYVYPPAQAQFHMTAFIEKHGARG